MSDEERKQVSSRNVALVKSEKSAAAVLDVSAIRSPKARVVLEHVARGESIGQGCYTAGCHRSMHGYWLANDKAYAQAYEQAKALAVEVWESEVKRRAFEGVEEPVYQQGRMVGRVRKYSDLLTMFFLKGARPDKYRDNYQQVNVQVNIAADVEAARKRVKQGD